MVLHPVLAHPRRSGRPGLALALAGSGLIFLLVGLLAARPHAPAPARAAAVPYLILRSRVTHFAAVLGHAGVLRGALEPTLPGLNSVRVVLQRPPGHPAAGRLTLVATMPGMAMPPVRTTLQARGGGYSGALTLPMFGRYHVRVTLETAGSVATGALTLTLPLEQ